MLRLNRCSVRSPRFIAMIRPLACFASANDQPFGRAPQAVQMAGNEVNARSATTRRSARSSRGRPHTRGVTQKSVKEISRLIKFRRAFFRHRTPPSRRAINASRYPLRCFSNLVRDTPDRSVEDRYAAHSTLPRSTCSRTRFQSGDAE